MTYARALLFTSVAVSATPAAAHYTMETHDHAPPASWVVLALVVAIPLVVALWEARKARTKP